ncbi:MAG: cytochrome c [Xanthobacteraceae bacterium]
MIRTVFAAASIVAVVLGISLAVAQQNVIKERKDLMKHNGAEAKIGADMAKGDKPFDLAAAHKMFATFEDAAQRMPGLYPPDSKSEAGSPSADKFSPTPKVWEDMADFKARFDKLGSDAKAADASVKDAASLKAALGNIGKNDCGACHHVYRVESKS